MGQVDAHEELAANGWQNVVHANVFQRATGPVSLFGLTSCSCVGRQSPAWASAQFLGQQLGETPPIPQRSKMLDFYLSPSWVPCWDVGAANGWHWWVGANGWHWWVAANGWHWWVAANGWRWLAACWWRRSRHAGL